MIYFGTYFKHVSIVPQILLHWYNTELSGNNELVLRAYHVYNSTYNKDSLYAPRSIFDLKATGKHQTRKLAKGPYF